MSFIKNIQFHQFLNLLLLTIISKLFLNLEISYVNIIAIIISGFLIEQFFIYIKKEKYLSFSGINSSFGVIFMIKSIFLFPLIISLFAGLFQKHIIKIIKFEKIKTHIFNPSNFSVIFAYIFFNEYVYINSQQLFNNYYVSILLLVLMTLTLIRTKQLLLFFSFMISMYIYYTNFITNSDYQLLLFFTSNSFLLFAAFMVTDPATTPRNNISMIIFGISISFIFILLNTFFTSNTFFIFLSLFLVNLIYMFRFYIKNTKITKIIVSLLLIISSIYLYFSEYNLITVKQNMTIENTKLLKGMI